MPGPARAVFTRVVDTGIFINPSDSAVGIDLAFECVLLGLDMTFTKGVVHANLLITDTAATWGNAIAAAMDAFAVSKGFSVAANNHMVPTYAKT